jgi:hypothetical protein
VALRWRDFYRNEVIRNPDNTSAAGRADLRVTNRSSRALSLMLEPAGEVYRIEPGQTRVARYRGDPAPSLSIDVHDGEVKIWEEGVGSLELEE